MIFFSWEKWTIYAGNIIVILFNIEINYLITILISIEFSKKKSIMK